MCCVVGNQNFMCHISAKYILDSNFNEAVIDKIRFVQEVAQNLTGSQTS